MALPSSGPVKKTNPWVAVLCGTFGIFLGWCFFENMDAAEKGTRDAASVPALFAFLYRLGGKWFAAGTIMLLSSLVVAGGVRDISRRFTSKEKHATEFLE